MKLKSFRKSRLTRPLPTVIKASKATGLRRLTTARLPASYAECLGTSSLIAGEGTGLSSGPAVSEWPTWGVLSITPVNSLAHLATLSLNGFIGL